MAIRCRLMLYLHMHQPFYKELRSNTYKMPWVRLHSLKNYADMPNLHLAHPNVKISYNLVPSLVEQIEDYVGGASDQFEQISLKDAGQLSGEDKYFILSNFFQTNKKTQIDILPRYKELLALKGSQSRDVSKDAIRAFQEQDYRDLQVLFNLAWSGWMLREKPEIQDLLEKGRNFSEEDKRQLIDTQRAFLPEVINPYKSALQQGISELTISPYYHPILPLLCDSASAIEALPAIELPGARFNWPEDAKTHVELGKQKHKELFNTSPHGMWPSEGSISKQACEIISASGIKWVASDRAVLANSLGKNLDDLTLEDLYSPWQFNTPDGPLAFFFRNTEFSDLLGFTYQYWEPERAAEDFVSRLDQVSRSFPQGSTPIVPVILDGENAWAYYEDNGRPFLNALYSALSDTPWLETILPNELIESDEYQPRRLDKIVAGSWIYGNLATWIGHHEKNRGWELLAQTRADYDSAIIASQADEEDREKAWKELLIAEGSDWFWWYGDDHITAYAKEFDSLFREHLTNVYRLLKLDPPDDLFTAIKGTSVQSEIEPPMRLISPTLDGYVTKYTEWINAGLYFPRGGGEAMHQVSGLLKCIRFGFDQENVYLRFDGARPFTEVPLNDHSIVVKITTPKSAQIAFDFNEKTNPILHCDGNSIELDFGFGSHLEFAVPWEVCNSDVFTFYAVLMKDGSEVEIHPRNSVISIQRSDANYNAHMWRV
jgi:alpha-amylase/alpha-mannosidase (GH57 family)